MSTNKKNKVKISQNLLSSMYFGFKSINPFDVTKEDAKTAKNCIKEKGVDFSDFFPMEELVALCRNFKEAEKEDDGFNLISYDGFSNGTHEKPRRKAGEDIIGLHVFDIEESIADAILIKTTESVLKDSGYKKLCFKINNIGGKTSQTQFNREATNYFRKNINEMSVDDRQLFKSSVYKLFNESKNLNSELFLNAPKPMDFLGDETREKFSEVLEYLEGLNIPYEVSEFTIGDPNYSTHTVFEVFEEGSDKTLAFGCRYNLLARKIGLRKDIPAGGAFIRVKQSKQATKKSLSKFDENKFFLIQIGQLAKIASLQVIEKLKDDGIVAKSLIYRDKLSSQLGIFKKDKFEHSILIGHKEALENSVTVKDAQGRSQKILKQNELVDYLKSL